MQFSPADLVNPYIGTISHLLTSVRPEVMRPYGMARCTPLLLGGGDYFCNEVLQGFPVGQAWLMPGVQGDFANKVDHSRGTFRCYYCRLELEEHEVEAEAAVSDHVYFYRFSHADQLLIACGEGSTLSVQDGMVVVSPTDRAAVKNGAPYAVIRLHGPLQVLAAQERRVVLHISEGTEVYGAVSYISVEQALCNLQNEVAEENSFDDAKEQGRQIWNELLGRARVQGNSRDRQVVFYTALFRAFQRMTCYTEQGKYFSGYDNTVHDGTFYTGDGLWDTFRCMHPLQLLLDFDRQAEIVNSYVLMYQQSGLMPSFPAVSGDLPVMLGFHAAPLFADSYAKGLPADYETAYEGLYKNATEQCMLPWVCNEPATELDRCYYEKGFFPALKRGEKEYIPQVHSFERRQAVAVTLEHAYDDWCVAQLARALGKQGDYERFMERSRNYRNLYHEQLGFMAPKSIDGQWVKDFDPKWDGGQGGRDYCAENNTWIYTWSVFHDIEGLAQLMGGRQAMEQKLDNLFTEGFHEGSKYEFFGQFPDSTGLMGQFVMGNEPAFHIPYLYDYCGAPWKTQKRLRDLMDIWFTNSPTGICGDEDGGAMSSWLVFSALGFYPVCPGKAEYAIGTPLFDEAQLRLKDGKTFTVRSEGAGDGLRYIQSATLNGKVLEHPFLRHEDLINGGELVLQMSNKPNKNWK
ncbi:MAG TPA: glycoside hydrolase family 92 protein [Candidatus Gallacutalibacter stercoravium]|nr:glycoside hydrolase family 92 protein [Candidatus Gallacutalibacter stercoravium]